MLKGFFRTRRRIGAVTAPDPRFVKLCGSTHQNHFRVRNSAQQVLYREAGWGG